MPKNVQTDLKEVVKIVEALSGDASFEEISREAEDRSLLSIAPSALQRRISRLVNQGKLSRYGVGRGTRYRLPAAHVFSQTLETGDRLHVSREGQEIRHLTRAPLHKRQPVTYNRNFLDVYQPNRDFYLSADIRHRLAEAGHPPQAEQPAGTYARQIFNRLLIDLSWNSSRLEGNTYSLLETENLLKAGESAEGKSIQEAQMILNHKAAIEMLVEGAEDVDFNRFTILNLHALLSENLLPDPSASGRLRQSQIGITGTVYEPLQVPQLIEEHFNEILKKAKEISDPFEQAFFAMVHLPYLQPFADVNKRVSRLAANIPFIRQNLSPLSFVGVPKQDYVEGMLAIYELNRVELMRDVFIWAYERSCERYAVILQSLGEPDPFRFRYRTQLIEIVGEVVRQAMNRKTAIAFIRARVMDIPEGDRARMTELAETELQSLHEGNFARFKIRPSEFQAWQQIWDSTAMLQA